MPRRPDGQTSNQTAKREQILNIIKKGCPLYAKVEKMKTAGATLPDESPPGTPTTAGSKRFFEERLRAWKSKVHRWALFGAEQDMAADPHLGDDGCLWIY